MVSGHLADDADDARTTVTRRATDSPNSASSMNLSWRV
jgi:hypothetical protein